MQERHPKKMRRKKKKLKLNKKDKKAAFTKTRKNA